jgi:hypothetical protein
MIDLKNQERPMLFGLPYQIDYADQLAILDYAYANSNSWSGQVQVWDDDQDTYDQTDYFGRVQITKLTEDSIKKVSHTSGLNTNWLNWACRLDSDLEWEWIDTPITPILQKYVNSIKHLYLKFNRVLILVQKSGSEIPLHTDKVVKNNYTDGKFSPGPTSDLYIKESDDHWNHNKYLTLKFPLTDIQHNNGNSIVEIDNTVYKYNAEDKLFAINEVDMKHGAKPVAHRRGVIFLDGILNYDALRQEHWKDLEIIQWNS